VVNLSSDAECGVLGNLIEGEVVKKGKKGKKKSNSLPEGLLKIIKFIL